MLKIEIETGGAAYRDEDGELDRSAYELRRNLKEIKSADFITLRRRKASWSASPGASSASRRSPPWRATG